MQSVTQEITNIRAELTEIRKLEQYDDSALVARLAALEEIAHAPGSSAMPYRSSEGD